MHPALKKIPMTTSTKDLLLERRRTQSRPGRRNDGRKVALVIEGGAMRGVVSAGMVAALESLGLRDCFDVVYGSSAGSISGAYFLAGQARFGTTIFYENINNRNFIDLRRIIGSKPIVSLEFLLYVVCIEQKPLKFDRVLNSDIPLNVVASSLNKRQAVAFTGFADQHELLEALRGSARIPFFAGPAVPFRDDRLLDASLYESIPFRSALVSPEVSDVVVLLTRPAGDTRSDPNWVDRYIVAPYLRRMDADVGSQFLERAAAYKSELDFVAKRLTAPDPPYFLCCQPSRTAAKVGALETNRARLVQGAKDGYRAVYKAFDQPLGDVVEILTPF
jgi:predicted patatin/cPLA2 family phospholipase